MIDHCRELTCVLTCSFLWAVCRVEVKETGWRVVGLSAGGDWGRTQRAGLQRWRRRRSSCHPFCQEFDRLHIFLDGRLLIFPISFPTCKVSTFSINVRDGVCTHHVCLHFLCSSIMFFRNTWSPKTKPSSSPFANFLLRTRSWPFARFAATVAYTSFCSVMWLQTSFWVRASIWSCDAFYTGADTLKTSPN